jgi:GH15 family glucan-1,4-alpha-glucosidase
MRDLVLGNGNILLCLDGELCLRDFYYPFVGMYNHVGGQKCRLGVWTDGHFQWVERWTWQIRPGYVPGSLVTDSSAESAGLRVRLRLREGVHFRENIYLKRITIQNQSSRDQEIRLFLAHDFSIQETIHGDTAFIEPFTRAMIHYKRGTYFLMNGTSRHGGIAQFATGYKGLDWAEGTWRDAEDGHLQGNPIAQGSVDSAVAFHLTVAAGGHETLDFWIAVGDSLEEVKRANAEVLERTVTRLLDDTDAFWRAWVGRLPPGPGRAPAALSPSGEPAVAAPPEPSMTATERARDFGDLPAPVVDLFHRSLLVLRTQIDNRGAILAANDSDHLQDHRDTYQYMWPRDGALAAYALDKVGCRDMTRRFFEFCADAVSEEGYLWHKYCPDGSIGSNWRPWLVDGEVRLPIQEDETALALYALWHHYDRHGDLEFAAAVYPRWVRPAADFLYEYRDPHTGLPSPGWDLWEERRGAFAFTAATVNAGLSAAAALARLLGDHDQATRYARAASEVRAAIEACLYDPERGRFCRSVTRHPDGTLTRDATLDSSLFGLFAFGTLPADDPRVGRTMEAVRDGLRIRTEVGGIARYTGDSHWRHGHDPAVVPGNPWFVSTLWLSQWQIARAHSFEDLHQALTGLEWACRHATPTGLLAEQIHPFTGQPLSVCPRTWSHSTFIVTVWEYLEKLTRLRPHGKSSNGRGTPDPARVEAPRSF